MRPCRWPAQRLAGLPGRAWQPPAMGLEMVALPGPVRVMFLAVPPLPRELPEKVVSAELLNVNVVVLVRVIAPLKVRVLLPPTVKPAAVVTALARLMPAVLARIMAPPVMFNWPLPKAVLLPTRRVFVVAMVVTPE